MENRGTIFFSTDLNGERECAREAGGKIRGWLEKERRSRGQAFVPRLSIKFCGGCNPATDRGAVAREIQEILGTAVGWVPWEEKADLVILLNGCLTACADRVEVRQNARFFLEIQGSSVSPIEPTP